MTISPRSTSRARRLLAALLGARLPATSGALRLAALLAPVTLRRDAFGIAYIDAGSDSDAWYALGFCHGQDRAFQLESLLRIVRGTLAEVVGRAGLAVCRLSRRIGFCRSAEQEIPLLDCAAIRPMPASQL